jgi:hypothetical protein
MDRPDADENFTSMEGNLALPQRARSRAESAPRAQARRP